MKSYSLKQVTKEFERSHRFYVDGKRVSARKYYDLDDMATRKDSFLTTSGVNRNGETIYRHYKTIYTN